MQGGGRGQGQGGGRGRMGGLAWGQADTASALPVEPVFRTSREDSAIRYPVPSAEQK